MSRYVPVVNNWGRWVAFDKAAGAEEHTPAYRDRESAQSWCDIRNAVQAGESAQRMHQLYKRHEEIRNM